MFVGRREEIELALRELSRGRREVGVLPLLSIHGDPGCGKRAFLGEIGERILKQPPPTIWIRPKKLSSLESSSELANHLAEVSDSNHPRQKRVIQDVRRELEKRLMRADLGEGEKKTEGTPDTWWAELLLDALDSDAEETEDPDAKVQIIFALDGYDLTADTARSWFQRNLEYLNRPRSKNFSLAVLAGTEESLEKSPDLGVYWAELPYRLSNITLGPFTLKETIELVAKSGLSDVDPKAIFEKSKGNLRKIVETLQSLKTAGAEESLKWVENLLRNRNASQRNWMLWTALLESCTPEGLSIFCNREEAREAFNWLKHFSGLKLAPIENGYRLDGNQGEALRLWYERSQPESFRKAKEQAHQFAEVARAVGSPKERNILALLSLFRYFNADAIKAVFDPPVDEILAFVESRPDLFDKTGFNYRLSPEYQRIATEYRKLVPPTNFQTLKQRVADTWERVRGDIVNEIQSMEEKAKSKESSIKDIDKAITGVRKDIKLHEKIRKSPIDAQQEENVPTPTKYPMTVGILWEGVGIGLLYFSILSPSKISVVYSLIGIILIIFGLFIPYQRARSMAAAHAAAVSPVSPDRERTAELNKNLRILHLKQTSLQNKKGAAILAIAKYRQDLERLNSQLQEPYV